MGNLEAFRAWVSEVGGARKAAGILGISEQYVCNLKSGHRKPGRAVAARIEAQGGNIRLIEGVLVIGEVRIPVSGWDS